VVKKILNLSHGLSEEAQAQIEAQIGAFKEIQVACQFDLERPLIPQIEALRHDVPAPDFIIPPSLGPAAYLVGQRCEGIPLIWLRREGAPPRWVLGGIEV
jgi:hypothetical protein